MNKGEMTKREQEWYQSRELPTNKIATINFENLTCKQRYMIFNQWISSLRGLLVLLVFISHLTMPIVSKDILFILGRIGVVGFFLIAGYLAVASTSKRNVRQFYFNRFIRIYPMFWILALMKFLLDGNTSLSTLIWNFTLFEEFVGQEKIIGASWMLPIMVLFFTLVPFLQNNEKCLRVLWWIICFGSLLLSILRFLTDRPFPTALCLLLCVGIIGFMVGKDRPTSILIRKIVTFEILLVICSWISYEEKAIFYIISYNLGFMVYYSFKRWSLHLRLFDILGKLGFTFFLGAEIPTALITKVFPVISTWKWYNYAIMQFMLAFLFSYILTRWCETPLLKYGKQLEAKL